LRFDVSKFVYADSAAEETKKASTSRVSRDASIAPSHAAAEGDVISDRRAVAPDIEAVGISRNPLVVIAFQSFGELTNRRFPVDHWIDGC